MFIHCHQIAAKMNEAGRSKTPFLFAINFEMSEGFFMENPLLQNDLLFDLNGITNANPVTNSGLVPGVGQLFTIKQELGADQVFNAEQESNVEQTFNAKQVSNVPLDFVFERYPESFETYEKRFRCAMEALRTGETLLLNLTIKTPIETSLSLHEIFEYSKARYRLYIPGKFVCFSPERFVKIWDGKIFSYPMKGTIDASLPNAAERLLNDQKEVAEHQTITEFTRDDLLRVATEVKVNRFRYIDRLKTSNGYILQTSSEIKGTLPADYLHNVGTLFFKLLPAGSISGTPRESTLRVIRACERQPRGFYSGVVGYFDGENLDSGVLIRFIEEENGKMYFRSGGGITIDSQCESEYNEAVQKVYLPF